MGDGIDAGRWSAGESTDLLDELGRLRTAVAEASGHPERSVKPVLYVTDRLVGPVEPAGRPLAWRLLAFDGLDQPAVMFGYGYPPPAWTLLSEGRELSMRWIRAAEAPPPCPDHTDFRSRERCHAALRVRRPIQLEQMSGGEAVLFVNFCDRDICGDEACRNTEALAEQVMDVLVPLAERVENDHQVDPRMGAMMPEFLGLTAGPYTELASRLTPSEVERSAFDAQDRIADALLRRFLGRVCDVLAEGIRDRGSRDARVLGAIWVPDVKSGLRAAYEAVPRADTGSAGSPAWKPESAVPLPWARRGLAAFSLSHQRSLLLPDLSSVAPHVASWRGQLAWPGREEEIGSALSVPIILERGETWGALELVSTAGGGFRPEDVFLLYSWCRLLSITVEQHLSRARERTHGRLLGNLASSALQDRKESLASTIAEHLVGALQADEVTVAPYSRTLWPLLRPEVRRSGGEPDGGPYQVRRSGLSRWLAKDRGPGTASKGIWVNPNDGFFAAADVRCFSLDETSPLQEPTIPTETELAEVKRSGGSARFETSVRDRGWRTVVGIPIRVCRPRPRAAAAPPADKPAATAEKAATAETGGTAEKAGTPEATETTETEVGAIVWVKNQAFVPFSRLRAHEMVQMARWLGAHLTQHQSLFLAQELRHLLFTRGVLEPYLKRQKERGAGHQAVMALLDVDGFRQVNASEGYPKGTELLGEFVGCMRAAAKEIEEHRQHSAPTVYFDLFRYGGDEFVVIVRTPEAEGSVGLIGLYQEWDANLRRRLTAVPHPAGGSLTFSAGVTEDLGRRLAGLGDEQLADEVVRLLGVCVRIAKNEEAAEHKTVLLERVLPLVHQSLGHGPPLMKVLRVIPDEERVVINVGHKHGVRRGMHFEVVFDVGAFSGRKAQGSESPWDPRPKADLVVIEVWPENAWARASRVTGRIEKDDPILLRLH